MTNFNTIEDPEVKLDSIDYIRSIDKCGLIAIVEKLPEQIEYASGIVKSNISKSVNNISSIGVVGVGTTRVCALILRSFMDYYGKVPVFSINDYSLPSWVRKSTLLFFVSFSGNTEEVISCFDESLHYSLHSFAITTGGHLEKKAQKNSVPIIKIPKEKPPNRTVLPYMLIPMMMICSQIGFLPIKSKNFIKAAEFLIKKRSDFCSVEPTSSNLAKQIALYCLDRIPLIYTNDPMMSGVILRWQYQFNENAKVLAYSSKLPEMSHNEIVGLEGSNLSSSVAPIFLTTRRKKDKVDERLTFTQSVLKERGYNILEIPIPGRDDLSSVFYGIYLGDYISVYLAVLRGVDPHAVELIDRIRI